MEQTHDSSARPFVPLTMPGEFRSLVERLRHVAAAVPDRIALADPDQQLTFAALVERIDRVAAWLRPQLPSGDVPVGVLFGHVVDAIVVDFALMRLDRSFVNLDPMAPPARTADIVELAGIQVLVASAEYAELPDEVVATDVIAVVHDPDGSGDVASLPDSKRGGDDAAFVVFTSGSTGRPKGVIETHAQMLNNAAGALETSGYRSTDRVALLFPLAFVGGPISVFCALLNGASLHLQDIRHSTPRTVIDWVRASGITILGASPHLLRALTQELGATETIDGVRILSTGGEGITGRDVSAFREHLTGSPIFVNGMGSSEAGSTTTLLVRADEVPEPGNLAVGRANPNIEVRVVLDDGSDAAPGETGQLMVVSHYLSGGYFNDDALNAAKFSRLPDGRRAYLQGDLARLDENGVLSLVGRADTAVKIRGYLVDVSEIEDALRSNPKVTEALVVPVSEEGAQTRLIAYVVQSRSVRPDSAAELRRMLRGRLTEYMVPGTIIPMAEMPRNERGKIDRTKLPVEQEPVVDDVSYTQHEQVIGGIWATVLGLNKVPLDGDFLALGGDSLSVEEMLSDVGERFGVEIASTELLASPTLREFSTLVERSSRERSSARRAVPGGGDMVRVRTGVDDRRVFCFAGGGALALQFLPLARHLDGWDVYAFQAHGIERRAMPDRSVEAHATRFIRLIRQVQPQGPYRLLGHSFGGMVALEVARRLRASGEEVALLGLLDTFLPQGDNARIKDEITAQFGKLPESQRRRLSRVIARLPRMPERVDGGRSRFSVMLQQVRARTAGPIRYEGRSHFEAFFEKAVIAARGYGTPGYDGRVLVVSATHASSAEQQWRGALTGEIEFAVVPSEHSALLHEPHATTLAAVVLPQLERTALAVTA